jgi:hypothetical protein
LIFAAGLFLLPFTGLQAEKINVSKLKKEKKEFSIERDIFSPVKRKINVRKPDDTPVLPPKPEKTPKKKIPKVEEDVSEEVMQNVAYEGYVIRNGKNLALLTVNGEFFVVGKDDIILEKYKIVNVDRKTVTIEVDSQEVEITLKGDDENEIQ